MQIFARRNTVKCMKLKRDTPMATIYPLVEAKAVARPSKRRRQWAPYFFLVVPLALYFTWVIGPTIATGVLSATNWDGISALHFTNKLGNSYFIQNFTRLFQDANFWTAFN